MTEGPDGHEPADLARDWATIWQSELSAAATDRERAEIWSKLLAACSSAGAAWLAALPIRSDGPPRPAAPQSPARPATADAASDARDAAIEQLLRRIDELERRLAERG